MTIRDELTVPATPDRVFEVLTRSDRFSALTGGAPAVIDGAAGGAFSLFGGAIEGRNIECAPGERVVQAWRPKTWEAGQYSLVRFELRPEGSGTRVTLEHSAYPDAQREHLATGWRTNYLEPMRRLFG
jgi:activator of HSP90 ATPase